MADKLQQYFPMIRTSTEVLKEIQTSRELQILYNSWGENRKKEFLDFCTGAKGAKILYDAFFKEILNPETRPERIESLISVILKRKVRLLQVLPSDSSRIADESSLLIMDILVELEDGSIANVEAQKLGYRFPGARSACYSADLLLRQYKRVLQEFIFIPLDVFHNILHNNSIKFDNKEKAWLAFLSEDSPEVIIQLIESYPEFKEMYNDIYRLCRNMEQIMGIFSEELRILDRNTVQLMIDEMQEEMDAQKEALAINREIIAGQEETIAGQEETIAIQQEEIRRLKELLEKADKQR